MPITKIHIAEGHTPEYLQNLMQITIDSVQKILGLPSDDRNIMLTEYKPELFWFKKPYQLAIDVYMIAGRSETIKKQLFQEIVTSLEAGLSISKETIYILVHDIPRENWAIKGGIPASEVNFDFKIEI